MVAMPECVHLVFDLAQEKMSVLRAYFMLALDNIVGLVYPAYVSSVAIKSADTNDDAWLLTYCVVCACFSNLNFFDDGILCLFPFYWLISVVFLVYCFLPPPYDSSARIYNSLMRTYCLQSSGQIDSAYAKIAAKTSGAFDSAMKDSIASKQQ
ncbi:receptor expression-enhancing protein 5-like [Dermacentor variabilis]|uniref:receptor expression-enhancing protein 5-like n=1 Tax=Dermacentor variabilis TaxID=34621 RepID=UPI003F5C32B7